MPPQPTLSIPQEYGEILKKYQQHYGTQTTVFMQVGSFYELYDFQDPQSGKTLYNVREIADILGLQISIRQDAKSRHDILTAGLPDYALHRWAAKMTSLGWTVIQVDQVKDSAGNVKRREVVRVISPGTHVEAIGSTEVPYVLCILFDTQQTQSNPPKFALATLDLTTGQTTTFSDHVHGREDVWTADSLQQFLAVFPPREIIIYTMKKTDDATDIELDTTAEDFRRKFAISQHIPIFSRIPDMSQCLLLEKPLARQETLAKIYSNHSLLNITTALSLKNHLEEQAAILLAQYTQEHISASFKSFQRNIAWQQSTQLILGNNALAQLQIVGQQTPQGFATISATNTTAPSSIISLFTDAITPMGKRAIRERIVRPLANPNQIKERHDRLETYINLPKTTAQEIETCLRFLYDLPRLHRRLQCATATRETIDQLRQSYSAINQLLLISALQTQIQLRPTFCQVTWKSYLELFYKHFKSSSIEIKEETDIQPGPEDTTFFNLEEYPEIAQTETKIKETLKSIVNIRQVLAKSVNVSVDAIRIEEREKEPFGFKTSTVIIKSIDTKRTFKDLKDVKTSHLKSGGWIDCAELQTANQTLVGLRSALSKKAHEAILVSSTAISEKFMADIPNILDQVEDWLEELDCLQCLKKTAQSRGWVRPTILTEVEQPHTPQQSSLYIQGLRHPIVESSLTRVTYVSHNVTLDSASDSKGWLIYGMNASGKSTLMKAVGIAVVLAQAGSFVPAKEMTLRPFQAIYTRILNHDNIFQGLSSFAVEMSELRDILRGANAKSLVLGDELCAGTESESAQALVASGIEWLATRANAKFLFATHLHEIPKIIDTAKLQVKVWHLHVDYNAVTKKLIYDRELRPGSGSALYGLEVARAMDLPHEFIEMAVKLRRPDTKKTSWSKEIVKQVCEVCGSPADNHLDVHHIRERHTANPNGILPSGQNMNHPRNLVVLCEKCHEAEHSSGGTELSQLIQTSDGPERLRTPSPNTIEESSGVSNDTHTIVRTTSDGGANRWSEEQLKTIHQTLAKFPRAALKKIRAHLKLVEDIDISEATLSKMKKQISLI